jgi:hypothetical protein
MTAVTAFLLDEALRQILPETQRGQRSWNVSTDRDIGAGQ